MGGVGMERRLRSWRRVRAPMRRQDDPVQEEMSS
eukprot:CAMPEP_0201670242 /NCGR_PEP_ID=MMETSP0494-20130426/26205_1 /ASSEMBLY_ACC=CAM_ASM_000839 /TAXON_ID=420259 /ORGANISM="Thalassiosira gravida, Strain GMp14c1" /LENGTH=33 /DNA_ID= /DNA_START= /DNA_END= /DNA_ORIENTATION=